MPETDNRNKIFEKYEDIGPALEKAGYFSNSKINAALNVALTLNKPLLIEGTPGVGKTALAKAVANACGCDFVRAQMYEGLTDDKLLYDYNYQKQLLTLEMLKPALNESFNKISVKDALKKADECVLNFYGKNYLIERPVLKSISGEKRTVLLIDEIDKAPEEIEYMLFEFLEDYSLSIPELGTIKADENCKPIVFITSNGYRDLSIPLKRRCAYLYIEDKTMEEYVHILKTRLNADDRLAEGIAKCLLNIRALDIHQVPSVAEGIEWTEFLMNNGNRTKEFVLDSLSIIAKDERDYKKITDTVLKNEDLWA